MPGWILSRNWKERGLGEESLDMTAMEFEMGRGNREVVLERLEQLEKLCGERVPMEVIGEMECYQRYLEQDKQYWEREGSVRKVFLSCEREKLVAGEAEAADTIGRSRMIRLALVDFLLGGDDFPELLKNYALAFEKGRLMEALNEYQQKKCFRPVSANNMEIGEELFSGNEKKNVIDHTQGTEEILNKIRFLSASSGKAKNSKIDIFLDGLSDKFLVENAENLLVCLMEMDLHESALDFF